MLIVPKKSVKVRKSRKRGPGRPRNYGGSRDSFFPGERLLELIVSLQNDCRDSKVPVPSRSLIYRQGAYMFIRKMATDLKKAKVGNLHAKRRDD